VQTNRSDTIATVSFRLRFFRNACSMPATPVENAGDDRDGDEERRPVEREQADEAGREVYGPELAHDRPGIGAADAKNLREGELRLEELPEPGN
jgi:hypothetical protein